MRKILMLLTISGLLFGGWWFYHHPHQMSNLVQQYVENGEIITVKAQFSPEQIMEAHRKELVINDQHKYLKPDIKLHPYLLLEIKYFQSDKKSREGMALWSLGDGEMVINTEHWEKSHGFEDALNAGANRHDYLLMQALARQKAPTTFDQLQRDLHLEKETLSLWISSALSKQLIVQKGNELQLHFQDPRILVSPETKMTALLVKKPYNQTQRVSPQYSTNQILKNAKAAFGEDFTVRNITEIYLPVYSINVANPDQSTFTSHWNAVNGQQMYPRHSLKGITGQ